MKKKALLCLVCLFFTASMAYAAADYSGSDLLVDCTITMKALNHEKMSSEDSTKAAATMRYIQGVIDGQTMALYSNHLKDAYCLPGDFTIDQAVRLISQHLSNKPLQLRYPAAFSVHNALSTAFPCK